MENISYRGDDGNLLFASILGKGKPIVILHGGGPDRQSIIPFAKRLKKEHQVIFPDIRGYGQSYCYNSSKHNWIQYANDIISLIDHLGLEHIIICGMGLGASIAERVGFSFPDRIKGVILLSPETLDEDGEGSSEKEIEMMTRCAEKAIKEGLEQAWKPFMKDLAPVIIKMVKEAFPRTDPKSFAAAMHIVNSQRLESSKQLSEIKAPTLVIPGGDSRHSSEIGNVYMRLIPNCTLGEAFDWNNIQAMDQLTEKVTPQISMFARKLF